MPETYTSGPLNHYEEPILNNELATRIVGGHVVLVSLIGIIFNVFMFFHFLSMEKISFYILCTSKTLSNTLSLLMYLCYIGPVNLFYTRLVSYPIDARLQQIFGFGLFLQGPMTEMLVTVNRFLIIIFSPTTIPTYSNRITVAALVVVWVLFVLWSTIPGFPDHCYANFFFDHVGYYESDCNQQLVVVAVFVIFPVAIFNNFMNVVLAIKLAVSAKRLSSDIARSRRKTTIRFFIQSCIQDWMTAMVTLSNILITPFLCTSHSCVILTLFSVDSLIYAIDGIVMFLFNYKRAPKMNRIAEVSSNQLFSIRASPAAN